MRRGSAATLAVLFVFMLSQSAQAWYWYPSYSTYRTSPYTSRTTLSSYTRPTATAPSPTSTASTSTLRTASVTETPASSAAPAAGPEATLLSLLNKERTSRGIQALTSDVAVTQVARAKSREMVTRNYFSHTSPSYGTPAQMLTRWGVSFTRWAENIAKAGDAYRIHASWMASSGHRANILNPAFTHVGIGTAATSSSGYAATQLFIKR